MSGLYSETNNTNRYTSKLVFTGGCRQCDGVICKPRRTFCSAECVHEYRLRSSGSYLRECVFKRDKGICCGCGFDTKQLAKELYSMLEKKGRKTLVRPDMITQ